MIAVIFQVELAFNPPFLNTRVLIQTKSRLKSKNKHFSDESTSLSRVGKVHIYVPPLLFPLSVLFVPLLFCLHVWCYVSCLMLLVKSISVVIFVCIYLTVFLSLLQSVPTCCWPTMHQWRWRTLRDGAPSPRPLATETDKWVSICDWLTDLWNSTSTAYRDVGSVSLFTETAVASVDF